MSALERALGLTPTTTSSALSADTASTADEDGSGTSLLSRSERDRQAFLQREADLSVLGAQWQALHLWVLRRLLQTWNSPHSSLDEVRELQTWLDAPIDPTMTPAPFSFAACCACWDETVDPVVLRRLLLTDRRRRATWAVDVA